jgi:hypothetical protein
MSRNLPPVIVRLLLNFYVGHVTRVEWNGSRSGSFPVFNGVKQGGIICPILFCVYIDSLLLSLAASKVGCFIGEIFVGALAYADDIVLLTPTANAMRHMLKQCDSFAADFNLIFNAKKSKCIFIQAKRSRRMNIGPMPGFMINGQPVEFVDQWPHLGHVIAADFSDSYDILQRRNATVGQINNVLCYFGKLSVILSCDCSHPIVLVCMGVSSGTLRTLI